MAAIQTTKGEMDESQLQKRTGSVNDENERTTWVEFWLGGDPACQHGQPPVDRVCPSCKAEQVHRSVNMRLKGLAAEMIAGQLT